VTTLWPGQPEFGFCRSEEGIFRPSVGLTQPPPQWVKITVSRHVESPVFVLGDTVAQARSRVVSETA